MEKDKGKNAYQITRICGVPLFKLAFKPTIINKEFIPEEGPIILCGNHLHVWDQFPVVCSTKRTTHWMAKKEYFDSKLGPFFKATGAISVDRNGDASSATQTAMDYLNVGSAVGIFPEGTRNGLKNAKIENLYQYDNDMSYEEFYKKVRANNPLASQIELLEKCYQDKKISKEEFCNSLVNTEEELSKMLECGIITMDDYDNSLLMPFKFGAVSMAAKTNAKIVPFAVTGDYEIGNDNLMVRFGEAFNCSESTLEEDNLKLRNQVLTLEKENLKVKKK